MFDQAAYTVYNEGSTAPCILVCEHASNYIPSPYNNLGLAPEVVNEHIAWDPGALAVTQRLAIELDCTAVASNYSRLLIDCNRPVDVASSIADVSEHYEIPGNRSLSEEERNRRVDYIYQPFHSALEAQVLRLKALHPRVPVIGIHSFTPVFHGEARPWKFSLMYANHCEFVNGLRDYLHQHEIAPHIGYNEPYCAKTIRAHTTEYYGNTHSLPAVIFEVRQDLLQSDTQIERWADLIANTVRHAHECTKSI